MPPHQVLAASVESNHCQYFGQKTIAQQTKLRRGLLVLNMVLNQLVKILGLVQILCNLSINLSFIVYVLISDVIPNETLPRYLPNNIMLLLCILPGIISLKQIDDKVLKWILLIFNLAITGLLFVIYNNIFKTYIVNA
jgi:hypothetical protein